MEPMIFVLLVVTIIGADEPIFTFKPSIAFDTLERCEERLISDLSEGDRVSTYEYFSQNRRMIISQTQFKKTFATCVETGVPSPLLDVIGNNGSQMPLDLSALKIRPRSRPQTDLVTTALNGASMVGDEASAGPEAATTPSAEQYRGMQRAIAECWNLGALSSAALSTIVVVEMELTRDGKPVANSIKMLGYEGGDDISAEQAFDSARRAIQGCGAQGFELPKDQFATWRRVELTFNSEKMRVR
jgi:hypothetical protein